jgi:septum formation protein
VKDLYVLENAKQKALEVLTRVANEAGQPPVVIGCDTVVVLDGVILEKPKDEDDAFRMLSNLSGRAHDVYSGVALFTPARGEQQPYLFFERTAVAFGPLEPQDIRGITGIAMAARSDWL